MKELLTEQQADLLVALFAVLATLGSLGWGLVQTRNAKPAARKSLWASALLFSLTGPAIWLFWGIYNSIEDHYGLDSVKALEINFGIVIAVALLFTAAHGLVRRWVPLAPAPKRRR